MEKIIKYGDLKEGNIIYFYGAKLRVSNIKHMDVDGKKCTYFSTEPFDNEALEILGFYAKGRYGGLSILTTSLYAKKG